MKAECREGHRRFSGVDIGAQYRTILSFGSEETADDPAPWERTVADLVSPTRTGSATDIVNVVSREMGADAKSWNVERLLRMVATLQAEADERQANAG